MRTNIQLDDDLIREARKHSNAKTKRGLIEEALATFIEVRSAGKKRAAYAERLQGIQGKLGGIRLREKPSDVLRQDRSR